MLKEIKMRVFKLINKGELSKPDWSSELVFYCFSILVHLVCFVKKLPVSVGNRQNMIYYTSEHFFLFS